MSASRFARNNVIKFLCKGPWKFTLLWWSSAIAWCISFVVAGWAVLMAFDSPDSTSQIGPNLLVRGYFSFPLVSFVTPFIQWLVYVLSVLSPRHRGRLRVCLVFANVIPLFPIPVALIGAFLWR